MVLTITNDKINCMARPADYIEIKKNKNKSTLVKAS